MSGPSVDLKHDSRLARAPAQTPLPCVEAGTEKSRPFFFADITHWQARSQRGEQAGGYIAAECRSHGFRRAFGRRRSYKWIGNVNDHVHGAHLCLKSSEIC